MFSTKFLKARSSSIKAFKSDAEGEEATETGCVGDMALLQVKKMNDALTIHVYSLKFLSYIFNHLVFIIPYRLNIRKQLLLTTYFSFPPSPPFCRIKFASKPGSRAGFRSICR